jgi:polynucleotide 5'-hydroxyl-kinase GRC3/NOL9
VPPDWADAAERIVASGVRRVLVLGPGDAGKSTFCRVLLRRAARSGRGVALLDADPGQKLAGPPACATLGRGEALALSALAFAGALDTLRGWRRLVAGVGRLAAEAADGELLVANTSGLLAGAGRRLKAAKIAAARPDLLVALGAVADLDAVLSDHGTIPALRLACAAAARRKAADGERRALRREAFRRYFAAAPVWTLDLRGLRLEGDPRGGGEAPPGPGALVALTYAAGRDLALGVVLGGDGEAPSEGGVRLRAPRPEAPVVGLRWGSVRLDEDGAGRRHQPSANIATASAASSGGTKWPPGNSR